MRSLRYKIAFGYAIIVCISIVTSIVAVYTFRSLGSKVGTIYQEHYQNVIAAENMVKAVQLQENALLSLFVEDPDVAMLTIHENRDAFLSWYAAATKNLVFPTEGVILDSIMSQYRAFLGVSDTLQAIVRREALLSVAKNYQFNVVRPVAERLKDRCFRLLEANQAAILTANSRARSSAQSGALAVLIASAVNILLCILASVYYARNVVRPLASMAATVRRISRGHLNQKIDITTNDEIGELSAEFNKMTERLEMYEAMNVQSLIAEKMKSETIVSSISDPMIVTDREGRIVLINTAAESLSPSIFPPDAQGRRAEDAVRDEAWRHLLTTDAAGREDIARQHRLFTATRAGRAAYYRPRQTEIADEHGAAAGVVTLLQDVTQFRDIDRLKSEFIATVSHELRTPLTSLHMSVDLLAREAVGTVTDRQRELLATAKDDCERLTKLIKELLDLSKLESGSYIGAKERMDLRVLVEQALKPLQLPLRERGVQMIVDLPGGLPAVSGDAEKLAWVITNLVSNALRYTDTGGRITLGATDDSSGMLRVTITDTGRGIPPDALDRVFEKFVQVHREGESTPGSVGLGLAIAREVVEAHGGAIWVDSAVGEGSTFTFTLPQTAEEPRG